MLVCKTRNKGSIPFPHFNLEILPSGGMVDAADLKSVPNFLGTGSSPVKGKFLVSLMVKIPGF